MAKSIRTVSVMFQLVHSTSLLPHEPQYVNVAVGNYAERNDEASDGSG